MQNWQTPLATLKASASDVKDGTLDLECSEVAIETSKVAEAGNAAPAAGDRLTLWNVDSSKLAGLDFNPRVVSFSAVGAVEAQEFAVSGIKVDEAGRSVTFTLG